MEIAQGLVKLPQRRRGSRWLLAPLVVAAVALITLTHTANATDALFSPSFPSLLARTSPDEPFMRTDQVTFDNYSLFIKGQRVFLHSGEFHTFRLPVPSLWPDILEKVKASGMNAISVYTHMGLLNPSRGVVDLNDWRSLEPLFDAAKAAGIWIILRPGPYINAETSAGGIPHWVTTEVAGLIRSNATDWHEAWLPYLQAIINTTVPHQITNGGPVIAVQVDNEFRQRLEMFSEYFAQIEATHREGGIVVPLTYNDAGQGRNFVNGTGAVDLYGMDAYPQGWGCGNPTVWRSVQTNYHDYHQEVNPWQPWFSPEFQGGSHQGWASPAPGYEACRVMAGPDFMNVFYLQNWASNMKLINYYMYYGGTSWGGIPFPDAYTSYDYGAAIKENRDISSKVDEMKRQSFFLRSSPDFYKTNWIADASTGLEASTNPDAFATLLRNPDTQASFYIIRQNDSTSSAITDFKLNANTATSGLLALPLLAPTITLGGRGSKIIVTDYTYGKASKLVYSTAQIFFAGVIDNRDVLFLHGNAAQYHETAVFLSGTSSSSSSINSNSTSSAITVTHNHPSLPPQTTILGFSAGVAKGLVTIWDSDTQLILYADTTTAGTFFSPIIPGPSNDPFANYWGIGTNSSILVGGPHLVRSATITQDPRSKESTLALRGDLKDDTTISIIGPKSIRHVSWNGKPLADRDHDMVASNALTQHGGFVGRLKVDPAMKTLSRAIPTLRDWKFKDSLPEISPSFDDGSWVVADSGQVEYSSQARHMAMGGYFTVATTACAYCLVFSCENAVLWRGHFNSTGQEKSLNLSIIGGKGFAASVWLNDVFLGTSFGGNATYESLVEELDKKFVIPATALRRGRDNVVTVVQDNMGLPETGGGYRHPKRSTWDQRISIDGNQFGVWKVQGKVGGYKEFPDKVRGVLNEGGLFGERQGWHLPGYLTRDWISRSPGQGLPNDSAGVGFFVTNFNLNIPQGIDAMLSITFKEPLGQPYRAFVYVNGWMMGKRIGNLGPQFKFPVHEGILDYRGENTVAIALWAMLPNSTISPEVDLELDAEYEGGVGQVKTNNPRWSPSGRH